jgi:hypothetical protein
VKTGCVVHTKYAMATLSWTEMRVSLRVCAQQSPAVITQVVFMRERKNKLAAWVFPRTLRLFLHPFIQARDMLSPERIKMGGSLCLISAMLRAKIDLRVKQPRARNGGPIFSRCSASESVSNNADTLVVAVRF